MIKYVSSVLNGWVATSERGERYAYRNDKELIQILSELAEKGYGFIANYGLSPAEILRDYKARGLIQFSFLEVSWSDNGAYQAQPVD